MKYVITSVKYLVPRTYKMYFQKKKHYLFNFSLTSFVIISFLLLSGCQVKVKPTYTPTGRLKYEDMSMYPISVEVTDSRPDKERFFYKQLWDKCWDLNASKYRDFQYVKLEKETSQILESAINKSLAKYGFLIQDTANVKIQIELQKLLYTSNTWDSSNYIDGVPFDCADIKFKLTITDNDNIVKKTHIARTVACKFDAFHQYQSIEPGLSKCLSQAVEDLVRNLKSSIRTVYNPELLEKEIGNERDQRDIAEAPKEQENGERAISEAPKEKEAEIPDSTDYIVSSGTGFFVSNLGHIATNHHVIQGSSNIKIYIQGYEDTFETLLIKQDISNDLAILKIKDFETTALYKKSLPYRFRASNTVELAEETFSIGYPAGNLLGVSPKFSRGSISSINGFFDSANLFQISNPIQPGNSGGPLLDCEGNVIGVVVSSANSSYFYEQTGSLPQNINFAVKSDYLMFLLRNIIQVEEDYHQNRNLKMSDIVREVQPYVVIVLGIK
jgi:S1-C subfamily serine protease